jgi:hypothetical protein
MARQALKAAEDFGTARGLTSISLAVLEHNLNMVKSLVDREAMTFKGGHEQPPSRPCH